MTRACLHLGVHEHPMKNGEYQDFKDRSRTLLEVERTPNATNSSILMEATKELVEELLLRPEGAPAKTFTFEELVPILDKCRYMSSPNIKNDVTSFIQVHTEIWSHGWHHHAQRLQQLAVYPGEHVPGPRL
jgi:hypothetical protein